MSTVLLSVAAQSAWLTREKRQTAGLEHTLRVTEAAAVMWASRCCCEVGH